MNDKTPPDNEPKPQPELTPFQAMLASLDAAISSISSTQHKKAQHSTNTAQNQQHQHNTAHHSTAQNQHCTEPSLTSEP